VGVGRSAELEMPLIADCCAPNSGSIILAVIFVALCRLKKSLVSRIADSNMVLVAVPFQLFLGSPSRIESPFLLNSLPRIWAGRLRLTVFCFES
jgi:hypothetical protein